MVHHKHLLNLELKAASTVELIHQYDVIEKAVAEVRRNGDIQASELRKLENRLAQSSLSNVKSWLTPPLWQPALEAAESKRCPSTTSWFIKCPTYQEWRTKLNVADLASPSSPALNTSGQLLLLQAKPGYGKTIISAKIVEDCRFDTVTKRGPNSMQKLSSRAASSAFYFFNKQDPTQATSGSAFRALIAQLLHIHQDDHEAIDLALLMTNRKGCGQIAASDAEVCDLLAIYLKRLPATTLIFDGVDECHDCNDFLRCLSIISADTGCKILLSSRPTVDFNNYFQSFESSTMILEDEANIHDIERYVRPEVQDLFLNEKLDESESLENIVSQICKRSRSMFLWANLMVGYLKSDFLTPADRHEAISELNTFEDLDVLYLRILHSVKKQCKGKKAWVNVQRLFQWVSMARRPLQVSELRVALAIEIGKPISTNRYLRRFETTVAKMSGALIEISKEGTVRFIHLSVLEFLIGAMELSKSLLGDGPPPLVIVPRTLHCSLSAECISYLLHSLPGRPLSGSSRIRLDPKQLLEKYPMSLYATQFWASHAHEALAAIQTTCNSTVTATRALIDTITSFISNKSAITAWTEASWTFGSPPDLCDLSDEAGELFVLFVQDLERMNQQWGPILQAAPNELWGPSIPAFMQSPFWVGTDSARVSVLGTNLEHAPNDHRASRRSDPLTIASRTSRNGLEVGIINIWPSRLFEELHCPSMVDISSCSRDWYVNYTVERIADQQNVFSMTFELPPDNVFIVLRRASRSGDGKQFSFPVAFSEDLRQIAILGCVLKLIPPECRSAKNEYSFHSQNLIFLPETTDHAFDPKLSFFSQEVRLSEILAEGTTGDDWYRTEFSPKGKYLLVIRGCVAPGSFSPNRSFYGNWQLIVHRDDNRPHEQPNFEYLAQHRTTASAFADRNFVFHPFAPVLAISRLGNVVLWFFEDKPPRTVSVFQEPLRGLHFSADGNFIYGKSTEASTHGQLITIPFSNDIGIKVIDHRPSALNLNKSQADTRRRLNTQHSLQLAVRGGPRMTNRDIVTNTAPLPSVLDSGRFATGHCNGNSKAYMLQQDMTENSRVVLHEMDEDGNAKQHHLTLLPQSSSLEHSHATLLLSTFSCGDKRKREIGLVINKSAQETYCVDEVSDFALPALFTRTVESIPTYCEKSPSGRLEDSGGNSTKRRKIVSRHNLRDVNDCQSSTDPE
ncbi:hypothetical protein GQ44DRAFT_720457 [Phaeosphaeriaceae sp. PMI808]|nr:hypothetical protein GQ44DRAFT_720457 [Phaeosphaeriaceae sp. PMI808]